MKLFLTFLLIIFSLAPIVKSKSKPIVLARTSKSYWQDKGYTFYTNEDNEPETVDEYYELINAFLEGWEAAMFFPNVQDCSSNS